MKLGVFFLISLLGTLAFAQTEKLDSAFSVPAKDLLNIKLLSMPQDSEKSYFLSAAFCDQRLSRCVGESFIFRFVKSDKFGSEQVGFKVLSLDLVKLMTNAYVIGVYDPVLVLKLYEKTPVFGTLIGQSLVSAEAIRDRDSGILLEPAPQFQLRLE